MKITEAPVSLSLEESELLKGIAGHWNNVFLVDPDLMGQAKSLFDKVFEAKPSTLEGGEIIVYTDGLVIRTHMNSPQAHFYAIIQDSDVDGAWKSCHIDCEGRHCFNYYPMERMPFSIRILMMRCSIRP